MHYLDGLNERQREAVLATKGPLSVLAGAGSGKTRVLTTRIHHLIREGTPPDRILAVTFTNKAAREMRERLARELGGGSSLTDPNPKRRVGVPFIATFHGLGRELLESYGTLIGVPRYFTIFDRDDQERAVKNALKKLGVDPKEVPSRAILSRISKAKGDGQTLESFSAKHGRESFRSRVTAEAWKHYDAELKAEKALDFDDLILKPVQLLEGFDEARDAARARWDFVHIDEYQDTNALQGRLANLLAGGHQNLFVVGDIDQTIYTWRGATIDNLLAFDQKYPDAKTIILDHNYRSTKTIVEASNAIIEKNVNRKEKRAVTDNAKGDKIVIHAADTAEEEARWIAEQASRAIQKGVRAEDIAVLYRTNFQSRGLEEAFLSRGIPYRLLGTRYFDRKEVKDVLSWIRLALEPSREADRMRAAQSPPRGIGKTTLGKLVAGKRDELRASDRAKVEAFEALVASISEKADTMMPSEFVKLVVEKSGLEASLTKSEEDQDRLENIRELATFATRYDELMGKEGIALFLADAALAGDQDELDRKKEARGVTLMTVHAAKGLEFDTVFVTGMEEGLFPHGGMEGDDNRDEEEERRLFYVAMTRAKKKLFLTLARVRKIYGTDYFSEPSQFLRDIDSSLTDVSFGDDDGVPVIRI